MRLNDLVRTVAITMVMVGFSSAPGWDTDVRMRIEPHELKATLHEPLVVNVTVNNAAADSVTVDFGVDFVEAFRLAVTGPDVQRRVLPPLPLRDWGVGGEVHIPALGSYTTPLILNEWGVFETPGTYRVEVSLVGITGSAVIGITILPRDPRRLSTVCAELARRALEASSYTDALLLARALSFVADDEAVPHLKKVAEGYDALAPAALRGLERIGDRSAVRALQDLYANPSKDLSQGARGSLGMIRLSTRDESLKQEIDLILANTKR